MSANYRFIDHNADIEVEVSGSTLEELFTASAYAWKEVVTEKSPISNSSSYPLDLAQLSPEGLLVSFLDELNYMFQTKKWILGRIEAITIKQEDEDWVLTARLKGEPFSSLKHKAGVEIKAVTFHQPNIKKSGNFYSTRIVFEI